MKLFLIAAILISSGLVSFISGENWSCEKHCDKGTFGENGSTNTEFDGKGHWCKGNDNVKAGCPDQKTEATCNAKNSSGCQWRETNKKFECQSFCQACCTYAKKKTADTKCWPDYSVYKNESLCKNSVRPNRKLK